METSVRLWPAIAPRLARRAMIAVCAAAALFLGGEVAAAETAVHGEGADPMVASSVQLEQAQARFVRAKALFDSGDFAAALEEFTASRAIVASPNARLYQARCQRELGRRLEAYSTYGRTMIEAIELAKLDARYGRTADTARKERADLQAQLGFVKLNIHNPAPDTELLVNGEKIRRTAWGEPVVVEPGEVAIELITPGRVGESKKVSLQAGQTQELTLSVTDKRPPPSQPPTRTAQSASAAEPRSSSASLAPYAYTAAAVGAVGFGAFAFFGLSSQDKYDNLEGACVGGTCPADRAGTLDEGKREQLWANIGLAVGVLGAAGAVTLFILDASDAKPERASLVLEVSPTLISVKGTL